MVWNKAPTTSLAPSSNLTTGISLGRLRQLTIHPVYGKIEIPLLIGFGQVGDPASVPDQFKMNMVIGPSCLLPLGSDEDGEGFKFPVSR